MNRPFIKGLYTARPKAAVLPPVIQKKIDSGTWLKPGEFAACFGLSAQHFREHALEQWKALGYIRESDIMDMPSGHHRFNPAIVERLQLHFRGLAPRPNKERAVA